MQKQGRKVSLKCLSSFSPIITKSRTKYLTAIVLYTQSVQKMTKFETLSFSMIQIIHNKKHVMEMNIILFKTTPAESFSQVPAAASTSVLLNSVS